MVSDVAMNELRETITLSHKIDGCGETPCENDGALCMPAGYRKVCS